MSVDTSSRTRTKRVVPGVFVAGVTALISGVSVFVNSYGVRAVSSPAVYTTAKNLVATLVLAIATWTGWLLRRRHRGSAPANFVTGTQNSGVARFGALHHAAGGVLRRIQNDQLGATGDESCELVDIEREIALLAQLDRHGLAAHVVDHRLINREARVGIDNFISFIN